MITTVTTSTVTTVTTIAVMGLSAVISMVAVISLIIFLTTKELVSVSGSSTSLRVAKFLSVGIVPMIMAFVVIVVVKIIEMLP